MKIDNIKKKIGLNIRNLRNDKGLTQENFCSQNDLKTPGNLSAIEKGRTLPTLETIVNICKHNQISADSLLFGSAIKSLQDDTDKYNEAKNAAVSLVGLCREILRGEESRLHYEIKGAIEKRESLETILQGSRAGYKLTRAQIAESQADLSFVYFHIKYLQKDLAEIKEKIVKADKESESLLSIFK